MIPMLIKTSAPPIVIAMSMPIVTCYLLTCV
ncbi:unnamed protein product [Arabidopsis thaliana]|uniref:Transmembrane protein n=3 Tax=Arabidopsis TaxID=3701 RepID=A0A654ETM1_ARATH|nr:uncharacterized protein AT2G05294 [Arabidopsis thaliana]AEC05914.1 transmembrane protein [Arabidopsis thaliana]KAG7635920.1 hypothetical protein ISN45_At02g004090 [Arabidopsis thaliana x Arabidopsis arenosa]CAA0358285.1 unnamed protein product [Arabidopsis thaliana]VYS52090.1 unnamed protein product [Arabidopsis thaliana]|eukprot:NP_001118272.1 transmembrane protein [Arabidopsis thaliana]